jgi:hypothetical protein
MPIDLLYRNYKRMSTQALTELKEAASHIDDCYTSKGKNKYQSFEDVLDEK